MKNNMIFMLLILFLTFPIISCGRNETAGGEIKNDSGKKKKITEEEYEMIRKQSQAEVDKRTRRVIHNEIRNIAGSARVIVKITQEFLPPDKSKWTVEETSGDDVKTTEIIYIGDVEYRKENGKNWVTRNLKSNGSGGGIGFSAKESEESTKEFLDGEIEIDGETYRVLISKTVTPQSKIVTVSKMWINKNGLIYKEESKSGIGSLEKNLFFGTTNYDYKVKEITIEAPIK